MRQIINNFYPKQIKNIVIDVFGINYPMEITNKRLHKGGSLRRFRFNFVVITPKNHRDFKKLQEILIGENIHSIKWIQDIGVVGDNSYFTCDYLEIMYSDY